MVDNIGKYLQDARTKAGLSLEDVADALCLTKDTIALLESNQFDQLAATTYTAGYIRSYCKYVKVDSEPLIQSYLNKTQDIDPELSSTSNQPAQIDARDPLFIGMTICILIVLSVLLAVWAWDTYKKAQLELHGKPKLPEIEMFLDDNLMPQNENNNVQTIEEKNVVESTQEEVLVQQQVAVEAPSGEVLPESNTSSSENNVVAPANEPAAPLQQNRKAPIGSDVLLVSTTSGSWVDVEDSNGYRLFYDIFDDVTTKLRLQGTAPFRVLLGDASNISLQINGKSFPINRFIRADKTAKISVQ